MYRSILVANVTLSGMRPALVKAAKLAHSRTAKVALLEVVYDELAKEPEAVISTEQWQRLVDAYIAEERKALAVLVEESPAIVTPLLSEVLWDENPEMGICKFAREHHSDLIIKPKLTTSTTFDTLRHPTERRILAQSTCPVLVSKLPNWDQCGAILACLDLPDSEHHALNESIVENASYLAERLSLPLHLLNVVHVSQLSLRRYSPSLQVLRMDERLLANRAELLQQYQSQLEKRQCEVHTHVTTGNLVDEIDFLVKSVDATMVVMGTAGRVGVNRLLLGNSAEAVLHHMGVDLLCVPEPDAVETTGAARSSD